ncbi:MAG: hypothetical protein ACRERC_01475 [Candidatus Binatia bacterium]
MAQIENGSLQIGYWQGVPLRIHWSAPLGMLLLCGFRPVSWLGFLIIILVHELGHAWLIRRCGADPYAITLTGTGGECTWDDEYVTRDEAALVAWGGVLGQALLFVVALGLWTMFAPPVNSAAFELLSVLTGMNVVIMLLNLIPLPPLDGAEAWPPVVRRLRRTVRIAQREWRRHVRRELTVVTSEQLRPLDPQIEAQLDRLMSNLRDEARHPDKK